MTAMPEASLPIAPPDRAVSPQRAKRLFDLTVATIALVLLAPLFAIVALAIKLTSRGPVFFKQKRVGFRNEPFTLVKFRTMRNDTDDAAHRRLVIAELNGAHVPTDGSFKLDADPRITGVGRLLRRLSIDELPQLFNVLHGSMSLVGPRPALPWETELFPPAFRRRTDAVPGITGLWQVSGRSRLSTLDMLALDLEYVDTRSFGRDITILVRTIGVVLRGDGAR